MQKVYFKLAKGIKTVSSIYEDHNESLRNIFRLLVVGQILLTLLFNLSHVVSLDAVCLYKYESMLYKYSIKFIKSLSANFFLFSVIHLTEKQFSKSIF